MISDSTGAAVPTSSSISLMKRDGSQWTCSPPRLRFLHQVICKVRWARVMPTYIRRRSSCTRAAMVSAGAFGKGFSSVDAGNNADQALLYTNKAAMMLHGGWTYGSMKNDGGKFVSGGNLGWMNFPPVEGGKGDPADTVGNPGQYLAISSKATAEQKETAAQAA